MDLNFFRGLITLAFMFAFLAIVRYAWSSRNRDRFEEAARLPLEPQANDLASRNTEGARHV